MNASEVRELISDELWQETNVNSVRVKDFAVLDNAVSKLGSSDDRLEFRSYCEQCLEDSDRNPIAIRYLATATGKHPIDDRYMYSVLDQYYEENLWDEVIFLANRILTFTESPNVLRALADCYEINSRTEEKIAVWERIVKVDYEETEILGKLAEYYEKKNDIQTSLSFYRSIIRRILKQSKDLVALKAVWDKIMSLKSDNSDYLIGLAVKIADSLGSEKGAYFLDTIYQSGSFDSDTNIDILKKEISFAPHNESARDNLVRLWKEKYKDNPRLAFCLDNTGITNSYLDYNVAVENFEKEIQFVEGAFVYHETWKLGRIKQILQDEMQIIFISKGLHKMSCTMAFSSLRVLPKTHIWVLKALVDKTKLHDKFKNDVTWGIKTLLSSNNNEASLKQMKAEICPSVLSEKEWLEWQTNAKKILSQDPYIGVSDTSNDTYTLRKSPVTYEEKMASIFKNARDFWDKLKIVREFLAAKGDTDSDEFVSMVNSFEAKAQGTSYESICAFLLLEDFRERLNMSFINLSGDFQSRYSRIENKRDFFESIQENELKKLFVEKLMETDSNYQEVLIGLLPAYMTSFMIDCIKSGPKKNIMNTLLADSVENCKEEPDLFLYLARTYKAKDWAKAKCTEESLLFTKLQLLASVNRKISNAIDTSNNKKRQKTLMSELFQDDKQVYDYLQKADDYQAQKLYSILKGIPDIEDERLTVKHKISDKFKDNWEAICGEATSKALDKKKIIPKGLLCTKAMLDAKTAELDHIMNVEIPENSKEIGTARELGDLRENAEYQYGKDKQKNLNFMMNKLTDEVSSAQVVFPQNVDTSVVSFGTKVTIMDNLAKAEIVYTILGPWESDPAKNILNFKAPLGQKIYNLEEGESAKFNINGVDYDYTVLKIELADF